MSITSRINEMSSHIEQAYDELQGLGADLTNVNKNIENISSVLDDIYDSMPQVSGEGTSLTLDDTRVGKIKSTLKGNTSQDGTPTPTSPIPINVVSGDNEINVVGKNLLDIDAFVKGRINNTTGNIEYASNVSSMVIGENNISFVVSQAWNSGIASDFIPISTGTYTFTFSHNREISVYIDTYKNQNERLSRIVSYTDSASPTTRTFTISDSNVKYIRIHFEVNTANVEYIVSDMQLEKGTATTYEPYQGNTYNIDLPVENLYNATRNEATSSAVTYKGDTSKIYINGTPSGEGRIFFNKVYLNAGTYTFSGSLSGGSFVGTGNQTYLYLYRGTEQNASWTYDTRILLTNVKGNVVSDTFTISESNYYYLAWYLDTHYIWTNAEINYQVERGTKFSGFTPYGTTPIELCKIGNYQDYFGKSDGRNLFIPTLKVDNTDISVTRCTVSLSGDEYRFSATGTDMYFGNIVASGTSYQNIFGTLYDVEGITNLVFKPTNSAFNKNFVCFYDKNKVSLGFEQINNSTGLITPIANTKYIGFRIGKGDSVSGTSYSTKFQLEVGFSASDYQPYGVGKWYLHKEVGKVVLNGSESGWHTSSLSVEGYKSYYVDSSVRINQDALGSKCNYFEYKTYNEWQNLLKATFIENTYQAIGIRVIETLAPTLEDFKTWLSTHNTIAYFALATPTTIEVEYQPLIDQLNLLEKAQSKENQTNISQVNNDLPFIISASALKEWQESTSLNSTLSMVNPLSLGNTLNAQENNTQPIEVDNIEPLEEV